MSPYILCKVWDFSKRISLEKAVDPHMQSLWLSTLIPFFKNDKYTGRICLSQSELPSGQKTWSRLKQSLSKWWQQINPHSSERVRRKEKRVREVKNTLVKLFSLQVRETGILPGVRPHWTSKGSAWSSIGGEISYHRVFCSLVVLLSAARWREQLNRPEWQGLWRDSLHLWNNYLKLRQ